MKQPPGTSQIDYAKHFDYDNLRDARQTILSKNARRNFFFTRNRNPHRWGVGSSFVDFDVVHVLITPAGETPPPLVRLTVKSVNGQAPFHSFSDLSLEWPCIDKLSVSAQEKSLIEALSRSHQKIFDLVNKSRKFRKLDDETKGLFMRAALVVARSSKFPQLDAKGRVEVNSVAYTCKVGKIVHDNMLI